MASTNHTANYELSQYVGSDKPTYLGDYNADMLKIDTAMKANNTLATNASTTASTANETAGTALTNAGTAQTTADNAQLTATSALSKATTNEANIANFNLTIFENPTSLTSDKGTLSTGTNLLHVAKNSDGSLAKVYGLVNVASIPTGSNTVRISFQTSLRPDEAIAINCLVYYRIYGTNTDVVSNIGTLNIASNGVCSTEVAVYSTTTNAEFRIIPCLLYIKNFGDVPEQQ